MWDTEWIPPNAWLWGLRHLGWGTTLEGEDSRPSWGPTHTKIRLVSGPIAISWPQSPSACGMGWRWPFPRAFYTAFCSVFTETMKGKAKPSLSPPNLGNDCFTDWTNFRRVERNLKAHLTQMYFCDSILLSNIPLPNNAQISPAMGNLVSKGRPVNNPCYKVLPAINLKSVFLSFPPIVPGSVPQTPKETGLFSFLWQQFSSQKGGKG